MDNSEQEGYEDLTEEETIQTEEPVAQVAPKQVVRNRKPAQAQVAPVVTQVDRYTAYHAEEVKGVVDTEKNRLFPDLDSQMAELLSKVDNIEKSTS